LWYDLILSQIYQLFWAHQSIIEKKFLFRQQLLTAVYEVMATKQKMIHA
jgi:hypothetical protein